jgi:hypothetical protein
MALVAVLVSMSSTVLVSAQDAVYPEPYHQYVLIAPGKLESWCLAPTPLAAAESYEIVYDSDGNQQGEGHAVKTECSVSYKTGLRVMALENNGPSISFVGFRDPDNSLHSGWINNHFIRRTPEETEEIEAAAAAEAKKAAAEATRQRQIEAKRAKARVDQAERAAAERRRIKSLCLALFAATADKKVKDLTVREEQQVRACQGLGLYPPA